MTESVRWCTLSWRIVRSGVLSLAYVVSVAQMSIVDVAAAPLSGDVASQLFGEKFLADNVSTVRAQAAELSDAQAFEQLSEWVFPGTLHSGFRLSGEFTQTLPAPVVSVGADSEDAGGNLVSPVFDLLDVAARSGRLKELHERTASIPDSTDGLQSRSKTALLLLLCLELGELEAAEKHFDVLYGAVKTSTPVEMHDQWPETLVAYRAVKDFPRFTAVGDLLDSLIRQRVNKSLPAGAGEWFVQIASLAGEFQYRQALKNSLRSSSGPLVDQSLANWTSISRERGRTRGRGFSPAAWGWNGRECWHRTGHDEDILLWRSPVRGNFQVEADVLASSTVQVLTAGAIFGPKNKTQLLTGQFRAGMLMEKVDPPFSKFGRWIRFRSESRDGIVKTWIHGRLINERNVRADFDPWVGIRSWSRATAMVRDFRISGRPQILEAVEISAAGCRNGWYAYHEDNVDGAGASAQWLLSGEAADGSQIVGLRRSRIDGSAAESLLRYYRPMIEDGSIEYEFFYRPGELHVHPTLDRLAVLLEPDGLRLHWITDGKYDRTPLSPDNSFEVEEQGDSAGPLPLKPDEWNTVRLSIADRTLVVTLNGEPVLTRDLEATNSRHFGLFHFADKTGVRVRNVVMRGDWPRELPSIVAQQLADSRVEDLDDGLEKLGPAFTHDFGQDGMPEEFFGFSGSSSGRTQLSPKGVLHVQRGEGRQSRSQVEVAFRMHGDLDVTADFAELQLPELTPCRCELFLTCEGGYQISLSRRWQNSDPHRLGIAWKVPAEAGTAGGKAGAVSASYEGFPSELVDGKLRIARRGDTVYVLVAEYGSDQFRILSSRTIESIGEHPAEVSLRVITMANETTAVTWKGIRLAADKLFTVPNSGNPPKGLLYVMNADGTGLRQLTRPIPTAEGMSHASPDWSPNGDLIAFDVWSGRAETSHSFTIKPDGTGLKDVGVAAMPTFSADGKRLAFTWVFNGQATMDLNGEDRKVITPDGWGAQWSPDGKWISYEARGRIDGRFASNIEIVDVKTKQKKELLEGGQLGRYSQIYWNMEWSPDSRQIVFKGRLRDGSFETCITSIDGSSKSFKVLTRLSVGTDFGWHPDGRSILMSLHSATHSGNRIFVYDLANDDLSLLETQPMEQHNDHAVWSPDGKQIVFSSRRLPEPIPWQPSKTD